jgi:hypothetical protein
MQLFQMCSGRKEYATVLTDLVRSRVVPSYIVMSDLQSRILDAMRTVSDDDHVLFKTSVLRYRTQVFTLPTPCSLGTLVSVVCGIVDSISYSMIRRDKFDLEWVGSELVFVPTLSHRFACVLTTASGTDEMVCLDIEKFYKDILIAFDALTHDMEEVPENFNDLLTSHMFAASAYDLRSQKFVHVPLKDLYANWVANNCV